MNLEEMKEKVQITEVARNLGYTVVKVGKYYSLKEHDSVRIDPSKNLYIQNSTGNSGSVIDFTMNFGNMDFKDSFKYLNSNFQYMKVVPGVYKAEDNNKGVKEFKLPPRNQSMKNVYAYLIKTRGIDKEIIDGFVKAGNLYQDKRNNCVFVSKDENNKPVFACIRGTSTMLRFLGDVSGSDYSHSFFIDNKKDSLVVTESVIDSMSIMTMSKLNGKEWKEKNYLAISGVDKYEEALKYHLSKRQYQKIFLCFDSDDKGLLAIEKAEKYIEEIDDNIDVLSCPPKEKDYNDMLLSWKKELDNKKIVQSKNIEEEI